jgi:orotate phosphoribosyltransferase-like protein
LSATLPSSNEIKAIINRVAKMEAKGMTRKEMSDALNMPLRTLRRYLNEYSNTIEDDTLVKKVRTRLLNRSASHGELAVELGVSKKDISETINQLSESGHSVHKFGD